MTFFAASLLCPSCGTRSPDDESTNMSSDLIPEPGWHVLRAGDVADVGAGDLAESHVTLRMPAPGEELHLLENWTCRHCQASNWAEVIFEGRRVKSIEAVRLTPEVLDRAHFISRRIYELFGVLTGESMFEGGKLRPDFAALLRDRLAAEEATP